jgi:hypothetical protein
MSRWTYKTHAVTVGGNTQKVRQLTWGEQKKYLETWKAGDKPNELPGIIVGFGAIEPAATPEDIESMPPDLMKACFQKILELTGVDVSDKADDDASTTAATAETPAPAPEKKDDSLPPTN